MPRGSKEKYTDKQKRQAEHIEASYTARGVPEDEAEARAWATINKEHGGGKLSGSGRKRSASSARKASGSKTSQTTRSGTSAGSTGGKAVTVGSAGSPPRSASRSEPKGAALKKESNKSKGAAGSKTAARDHAGSKGGA